MQRRITLIQKIRTNQPGEGKFYSVESLGHVQILEQTTLDPYCFVVKKGVMSLRAFYTKLKWIGLFPSMSVIVRCI